MQILIDGDVVAYKAAFATEYQTYHTDGSVFRHKKSLDAYLKWNFDDDDTPPWEKVQVTEEPEHTEFAVRAIVQKIIHNCGVNDIKIFVSGEGNFRRDVPYPVKYKGNRPPKPSTYQTAYNYLVGHYGAVKVNGVEVDDALGIHQTRDTVIASVDKDLLTIPGFHYNMDSDPPKVIEVTEAQAERNFWFQMLTGDRVDNIVGIKGVGPVKANKILDDCGDARGYPLAALELYRQEFKETATDMFTSNGKLLKILREVPDGIEYSLS